MYIGNLEYAKYIILTCCVLHNIAIRNGCEFDEIFEENDELPEDDNPEVENEGTAEGAAIRDSILFRMFPARRR